MHDASVVQACLEELQGLFIEENGGDLAAMGSKDTDTIWRDTSIRGDHRIWIQKCPKLPSMKATQKVLASIDQLRLDLEWRFAVQLQSEVQATHYPGDGSRYVSHKDYSPEKPRMFTFILYLNPDWQSEHGGYLRCHLPESKVDIAPEMNRCVSFRSEILEHEVLPSFRDRYAISCWFTALPEEQ
eukprot:Filipodium_phascolosomae@DN6825_c0_g1_i1.p1